MRHFKGRCKDQETNYLPQLAIGFRDFAGTGLFSSEYLTSSKRFGNLDFTLGIGFGALSSADDNISNPLSFLSTKFKIKKIHRNQLQ